MEFLNALFVAPLVMMIEDPIFLTEVIVTGLLTGTMYSLVALGFVLIYKASGVFNFSQGIMVLFAALTLVGFLEAFGFSATSVSTEVAPWYLVIVAILLTAGVMLINLLPAMRAVEPHADGKRHVYHLQDTHFNARGNDVAGRELARFLREHLPR